MPARSLEASIAALQHRGPDDAGRHVDRNVAFGFRRLSILDLSTAGHQPMHSADGRHTVVFNGEIFNYVELRDELAALGHLFRSASDTEVLLAAYREWGRDCVTRFNGMWAFVIHDRSTGALFGARDRFGVKPLYVCETAQWLLLASEPAAIGASGLHRLEPDWQRFAAAVRWHRMDHDAGSCLAGVRHVPAGHRFDVDERGTFVHEPFWRPPAESDVAPDDDASAGRWVEQLGALLSDAVRLRLRSDVPVGFTLSGGIDSSLLICEAARLGRGDGELLAFSYQDPAYDEREPIADTVAQTGAHMVAMDATQLDVVALLPDVVRANGEPVHSLSAVANYALFKLARAHGVKVLLGGQGADEAFGGYSTFQWDRWHALFEDRRWAALHADVAGFARLHGRSAGAVLASTLRRSLRIALRGVPAYRRWQAARRAPHRSHPVHEVYSESFLALAGAEGEAGQPVRIGAAQRRALGWWPLPMYLRIEDRVSMAHGVEARLPFMDYRLVEHALRMPDCLKFSAGVNKVGLRRVADGRVPASVSARLFKLGFPVGDSAAMAGRLHALVEPLVQAPAFRTRDIYDHAAVARLMARAPQGADVDTLLSLAQSELWLGGLASAGGRRVKAEDYRRAAVSGARWTIASRIALQLFTWPVTILVMRLLDPGDYGLLAMSLVVSGFVALFAELGLGVALVQADEASEQMQRAACSLIFGLNATVAAVLMAAAPFVAEAFEEPDLVPVLQVLTLDLLVSAIAAVPQAMLERELRFRELSVAQMAAGFVGSATTLCAALFGQGVWSLVAGMLMQGATRATLILWYHGRAVFPGSVRGEIVRPMIRVSGHVIASRGLWYWYGQSDVVVIGRVLHSSLLGLYSVAAQLAMLPAGKAMEAVNRVAFPILSRLRADAQALALTHRRLVALLALYGFGICWGLGAVAPEFVHVVLGPKWAQAALPLACLCLVAPLRMLCSLHNTITTALGAPEAATKELVLASLAIPAAVAVGAWTDGLYGASLAWLLAYPVVYLLSNYLTCRAIGVAAVVGVRPLLAPFAAGTAMHAAIWLLRSTLGARAPSAAMLLALECAAGALVYLGVLGIVARPLLGDALGHARQLFGRNNRPEPSTAA